MSEYNTHISKKKWLFSQNACFTLKIFQILSLALDSLLHFQYTKRKSYRESQRISI